MKCLGEIVPDVRAVPNIIGRDVEQIGFQEEFDGNCNRMKGLIFESLIRRPLGGFSLHGGVLQENRSESGIRTCGFREWRQSLHSLRYAIGLFVSQVPE